jgi:murein DD-endopeptidase MepM/ murein hydrolase activator NlpD
MKYIQRLQYLKRRIIGLLAPCWLPVLLLASVYTAGLLEPVHAALQANDAGPRLVQVPKAFMHNPYYGTQDFRSRINSYFDHDKPWYANDGIFVRYDGKRWTGSDVSVLNCQAGDTCYDGHNGYDLHMRFEPVLSAAAGTVVNAGWYNPQNHNDSFGLWAAINHGNGFATLYGHLSALTVSVGERVGAQWQIGTSGTTGSSTGPHLHFGTYYYPSWQPTDPFGWTGKYTDPNTVPDRNLWTTGANVTPVPLLAGHGKSLAPDAVLVDDNSSGWSSSGQWFISSAKSDIGGALHWTKTTVSAASATATWQTPLPADGYYEVGAFVDDNHASSGWASYTITSNDPEHPNRRVSHRVEVDEEHIGSFQSPFGNVTTGAQWVGLGTYYFKSGQMARVALNNATGEDGQQIAADGIEFAPLAPQVYNFKLGSDDTPPQMAPGANATVNLTLTNTGNFPWPAQGLNAVQVVYRWLDAQGHTLTVSTPISLSQNIPINATGDLLIHLQAPVQAGTYTLQWDLIQGPRIFSQQGALPKNDTVIVTNSPMAPVASPTALPGDPVSATPGSDVTPTPSSVQTR